MNYRKSVKPQVEKFKINKCLFCWIFDGKGSHTQKHEEFVYRKYINRNYTAKSNQYK